jgi:hypothetical protein
MLSGNKKTVDAKEGKSKIYAPLGIDELAGYAYSGNKQGNQYNRTTRALADYCGSRMSPGVWELIVNGTEVKFEEPKEHNMTGKVSEFAKVKFSRLVDQWLQATEAYKKDKTKIVIIIRNLCVPAFRQSVEGHEQYSKLEPHDVVGLLKLIRELTFNAKTATQYGPMTALSAIVTLLRMRQGDTEDATTYYHRMELPLEAIKDVCGGPLAPMSYLSIAEKVDADNNKTQEIVVNQDELEKFNTCIFLLGLDPIRHKKWVAELDTDFVANNDNYPKTLREALAQAVDREDKIKRNNKQKNKNEKNGRSAQSAGEVD